MTASNIHRIRRSKCNRNYNGYLNVSERGEGFSKTGDAVALNFHDVPNWLAALLARLADVYGEPHPEGRSKKRGGAISAPAASYNGWIGFTLAERPLTVEVEMVDEQKGEKLAARGRASRAEPYA